MSRYTAEEREEIMRSARETLERLNAEKWDASVASDLVVEAEDAVEDRWSRAIDPLARSNAGMDRWREQAAEQEQEQKFRREREARERQERQIMTERKAQSDAEWNKWADAKIAAAIKAERAAIEAERAAHDRNLTKELGKVVSKLRDEIREAVGELRAEINVKAAAEKSDVIDLPRGWWRRSDAA
jgi:hypothetical protein